MAHSLGYPTDIDRQPDRKERSQKKQRGSVMRSSWGIFLSVPLYLGRIPDDRPNFSYVTRNF